VLVPVLVVVVVVVVSLLHPFVFALIRWAAVLLNTSRPVVHSSSIRYAVAVVADVNLNLLPAPFRR